MMLVLLVLVLVLVLVVVLPLLNLWILMNIARCLLVLLGLGLLLPPHHLWRRPTLGGVCHDP